MIVANFSVTKTKYFNNSLLFMALIVVSYHQGAAQEKCNQNAVQNILQIWTQDVTGECSLLILNKLIDFYENVQNITFTGKTKSICKPILKNEARKTIVHKFASLLSGSLDPSQNRVNLESLLKRIDQQDGLLSSSIDMAYWSLGATASQELGNMLLMLSDSEAKVHALLEFERLAKSPKDNLSNSKPITKDLNVHIQYANCEKSLNNCINTKSQMTYPPPEFNTTLQAIRALGQKCQTLHLGQYLEKLEQEVAYTWRNCTFKIMNIINMKSTNMKGHLFKLNFTLGLIDEGCRSPDKADNVIEQIGKFEKALDTMKKSC